jgi:hypothetical protein
MSLLVGIPMGYGLVSRRLSRLRAFDLPGGRSTAARDIFFGGGAEGLRLVVLQMCFFFLVLEG